MNEQGGAMPTDEQPYVVSHAQARALLDARAAGLAEATTTLDLGLTSSILTLNDEGVRLSDGRILAWGEIEEIAEQETACFALLADGTVERIGQFSEALSRHYSLFPTAGAPTLLIGGFSMHRIKGTDPMRDTLTKVRAAAPLRGRVLDTSTGLGYTAIEAAKVLQVEEVVTIEIDPTTLAIARRNPWSRALFADPKIRQMVGDAYEVLPELPDESFSRIIHDPPVFSLAGELYSGAFYRELFRVLHRNGRLFHYIGSLESKAGAGVARGVVRRLKEAGFVRVDRRQEAFGVVAFK
jgi:predicted methyltransferase